MSFFSAVGKWFKQLGSVVASALGFANIKGLTDAIVTIALRYVKEAAVTTLSNPQKRDWVEAQVKARTGLSDSIVALAVQLAVQAMKAEVAKIPE